MKTSYYIYALMCSVVNHYDGLDDEKKPSFQECMSILKSEGWVSWKSSKELNIDGEGYFGRAFYKINEESEEVDIVFAHRATCFHEAGNLLADIAIAEKNNPKIIEVAEKYISAILCDLDSTKAAITHTYRDLAYVVESTENRSSHYGNQNLEKKLGYFCGISHLEPAYQLSHAQSTEYGTPLALDHNGSYLQSHLKHSLYPHHTVYACHDPYQWDRLLPTVFWQQEITKRRQHKIRYTHTGFSLGGFISGVLARKSGYENTYAIAFDNPGIDYLDNVITGNGSNITNILTVPNIVNTCNKHYGKIFQLDCDFIEFSEKRKDNLTEIDIDFGKLTYLRSNQDGQDGNGNITLSYADNNIINTRKVVKEIDIAKNSHNLGKIIKILGYEQDKYLKAVSNWPVAKINLERGICPDTKYKLKDVMYSDGSPNVRELQKLIDLYTSTPFLIFSGALTLGSILYKTVITNNLGQGIVEGGLDAGEAIGGHTAADFRDWVRAYLWYLSKKDTKDNKGITGLQYTCNMSIQYTPTYKQQITPPQPHSVNSGALPTPYTANESQHINGNMLNDISLISNSRLTEEISSSACIQQQLAAVSPPNRAAVVPLSNAIPDLGTAYNSIGKNGRANSISSNNLNLAATPNSFSQQTIPSRRP